MTSNIKTILIVETDGSTKSALADALAALSIEVLSACSSADALDIFTQHKPSCIVINIESEAFDGLTLCQNIRNLPAGGTTPILILAERSNQQAFIKGFDVGATDFIIKSISTPLFVHRIQFALKSGELLKNLEHNTVELENIRSVGKIGTWIYRYEEQSYEFAAGVRELINGPTDRPLTVEDIIGMAPNSERAAVIDQLNNPSHILQSPIEVRLIPTGETEPRTFLIQGHTRTTESEPEHVIGTIQDITETRKQEEAIHDISNLLELSAIAADMTFVTIDLNGVITHFVGGLSASGRYAPEKVIGKNSSDIFDDRIPIQRLLEKSAAGESLTIEYAHEDKILEIRTGPLFDRNQQMNGFIATAIDVTKRVKIEEQLRYMAQYDELTKLPNRVLFQDRLLHAIDQAKRTGDQIGLLFFDLDHFKKVNDTFGHNIGDQLLIEVAQRVKGAIRSSDTLARLGGDEFTIIIENDATEKRCSLIAKKILTSLKSAFLLNKQEVFISTSIGITIFPIDGNTPEELLKNADAAMYESKRNGRNQFSYYSSELNRHSIEQLKLENDLRNALSLDQFELYYQPKIDLSNDKISGAEALIRWHHPERGIIPPDIFIPILESTGLIVAVGEWVIKTACRQLHIWRDSGHNDLSVAVNLSARQFSELNLPNLISNALIESEIDARFFEVEITESMLMENLQNTVTILEGIKKLGVTISIDDFGTGYSSLEYLKKLPIHAIKIDRSFVSDILHDKDDFAITKAIVAMSKGLQLKVIAEGVEELEQQIKLKEMGCDGAQGYLFSPPVPANIFENFLTTS